MFDYTHRNSCVFVCICVLQINMNEQQIGFMHLSGCADAYSLSSLHTFTCILNTFLHRTFTNNSARTTQWALWPSEEGPAEGQIKSQLRTSAHVWTECQDWDLYLGERSSSFIVMHRAITVMQLLAEPLLAKRACLQTSDASPTSLAFSVAQLCCPCGAHWELHSNHHQAELCRIRTSSTERHT